MSNNAVRLSNIIAPSFHSLHRQLTKGGVEELWCKGGRGSTKSSYISIAILLLLQKDPEAHAFISRRYDNELRDSVYGQLQWAANKLGFDRAWRFMVSPMQAVNQLTGQRILFRGVDNPLKAKSINLGHGYVKIFWAEEVDQYGSMEELRSIMQSIFRGPGANQVAFFSYNPPRSARAWVNREVTIPKDGRVVHSSDYRDVPPEWLGERFLNDAKHLAENNETAYRHEYLGEQVGTGLEVFNNVSTRVITSAEKSNFTTIYQGLDFGYAADPLAFERMYFEPKTRKLYIFEEISGNGISNRRLSEMMTVDQKHNLTLADKAEPKSIDELRNDHSLKIMGADKKAGSVEHGVKWLADLAEIIIDPVACPLAAREFVNYALETNKNGEVISRYPDKDNHAIDAVRYGLFDVITTKPRKMPQKMCDVLPVVSKWGGR
jgi:phage terminase large subunit